MISNDHPWLCWVVPLLDTENKKSVKFVALRVVAVAVAEEIWVVDPYERVFETVFDSVKKHNGYLQSGRLREVVAERVDCIHRIHPETTRIPSLAPL